MAERLELPKVVIDRARSLLDDGVRQVSDLIRELEQQRDEARVVAEELAEQRATADEAVAEAAAAKVAAEEAFRDARAEAAADYAKEVAKMEQRLSSILAELKVAARSNKGVTLDLASDSLAELRLVQQQVHDATFRCLDSFQTLSHATNAE